MSGKKTGEQGRRRRPKSEKKKEIRKRGMKDERKIEN